MNPFQKVLYAGPPRIDPQSDEICFTLENGEPIPRVVYTLRVASDGLGRRSPRKTGMKTNKAEQFLSKDENMYSFKGWSKAKLKSDKTRGEHSNAPWMLTEEELNQVTVVYSGPPRKRNTATLREGLAKDCLIFQSILQYSYDMEKGDLVCAYTGVKLNPYSHNLDCSLDRLLSNKSYGHRLPSGSINTFLCERHTNLGKGDSTLEDLFFRNVRQGINTKPLEQIMDSIGVEYESYRRAVEIES